MRDVNKTPYYRPALPDYFEKHINELKKLDEFTLTQIFKNPNNVDAIFDVEVATRALKAHLSSTKSALRRAFIQIDELSDKYNARMALEALRMPLEIKAEADPGIHEAVPVVSYSDWHVEEVVEPGTIQGLNKYNPDIAKARSQKLAINTVKVLRMASDDVKITKMVIALIGDFITGWLHPEGEQTNAMAPIDAALFAAELLEDCIYYVKEHTDLEQILLPCLRGNHGRTTKRMQHSNERGTNYETMIYSILAKRFEDDERIKFYMPDGELAYIKVLDQDVRIYHGQQIRYNGGIGGISISLNKKQANWDKTKRADYNFHAHWHNLCYPNRRTTQNGSLIGYNAYAESGAFEYAPPEQAFTLFDGKREQWTLKMPIYCD